MKNILSNRYPNLSRSMIGIQGIEIFSVLFNLEYGERPEFIVSDSIYKFLIDEGEDDTFANAKLDAIADPTCSDTGLQVDVTVGTLLNDSDTFSAHATEVTTVLVTVGVDDSTKLLEIISYTKTTGEYGDIPAGKTHCYNLKSYTIAALASTMTEVESWL